MQARRERKMYERINEIIEQNRAHIEFLNPKAMDRIEDNVNYALRLLRAMEVMEGTGLALTFSNGPNRHGERAVRLAAEIERVSNGY
jgi:hypothetical protein